MAQASYLSHREKTLSLIAGVLLLAVVAVNSASAQNATGSATSGTDVLPPPLPPTPVEEIKPISPDDRKNQLNELKNERDRLKDRRREVKDIQREANNVDVSVVEGYFNKLELCLNARDADVGGDFWSKIGECHDMNKDIEDEFRDKLRPMRDCGNFAGNAKNRRRELKDNIERQIKDIKRNDKTADTSALVTKKNEIESLLGKLEQLSVSCTADTINDGQSLQSDIDYAFRDWYDLSNEASEKSNESRRLGENTKQFEKDIKRQCEKDMGRQLKDFEKNYARWQKAGTLPADAEGQAQKVRDTYNELCVVALGAMQQALKSGDMDAFDSARNDFYERQRDFNDTINEANNVSQIQEQAKNALREITQREKDFKQMQREFERVKKQSGGLGNPEAEKLINDYTARLAEAKEAVKTDPQSWWDGYQQDLNDIQNEFWNSFQKVQAIGDVARWLKDNERELKFREKDLKNIKRECPEVGDKLADLLNDGKQTLQKIRDLAGSDPEEARDSFYLMDDLRFAWDETQRSCWEGKQMRFELGRIMQEIKFAKKQVNDLLKRGKVSQEEGNACLVFINDVEAKVENSAKDSTVDFIEEFFEDLEDEAEEVCPFIEDSGEGPGHEYYREFIEENVRGIDNDEAASMLEKVSQDAVSKVLQRLLSDPAIIQNLLNAAGEKNRDAVANTLEATTTFYDEKAHADLLNKKAEILELTKQLEGLKTQVQIAQDKLRELEVVRNEIASYNFYGSSGDDIRSEVESFITEAQTKGLSKDAIRQRIDQLKTKKDAAIRRAKEDKLSAGIIPFYDTDDNDWFTKFVLPLKNAGIIAGKGEGKFDPNGDVTVAELLTMAFRLSGDKETRGTAKFCDAAGHWANKFVLWAENRGLSIVAKCTNLNRPALRWEVAQVLVETGKGEVEKARDVCFSDVKVSDQSVNSAVCAAKKSGLMKGENGKANAYNRVNRAQAATMVKQAAEKLFGISFADGGSDREGDEGGARTKIRQSGDDEEDFEFDDDDDDDEDDDEEDFNAASGSGGKRSRCWWDNQCTDLMSAQLVTPDECEAAGGEGWGPDEDECTAL